jgi:aryl sulfotransferase
MTRQGKNIVWLASYPKSGNTWFRVFLTNLLQEKDKPANINELITPAIASSRQLFDEATGLSASDLTKDEIELLRPAVYRYLNARADKLLFHKIHDAYTWTSHNEPLVPTEASLGTVYFVRNPLDLVISFAHHAGESVDSMIRHMRETNYSFCGKYDRLYNQLEQKLLSWSGHIESWLAQENIPVHVMRYEDMKKDTFTCFRNAIVFAGLDKSEEAIRKAIRFSEFEELQRQEKESGFREKAPKAEIFFRKGKAGGWQEVLSTAQVEQIIADHGEMMKRFGYIDMHNNPILEP